MKSINNINVLVGSRDVRTQIRKNFTIHGLKRFVLLEKLRTRNGPDPEFYRTGILPNSNWRRRVYIEVYTHAYANYY